MPRRGASRPAAVRSRRAEDHHVAYDGRPPFHDLFPQTDTHPAQRVDFDPEGERNCRIAACRLRTHQLGRGAGHRHDEIVRVKRELGPAAILSTPARITCGATSATGTARTSAS